MEEIPTPIMEIQCIGHKYPVTPGGQSPIDIRKDGTHICNYFLCMHIGYTTKIKEKSLTF
jgi:hypothetical protein